MDWKAWADHKAGEAKLSLETAEQYVSELILSRSITLQHRDEKGNQLHGCYATSIKALTERLHVIY